MANEYHGFWGGLIDKFKGSLIREKLEADLLDTNAQKMGELEYFIHTQGHTSLKISIKASLKIPNFNPIFLEINDSPAIELYFQGERIKQSFNEKNGDEVPAIQVNDQATICFERATILKGKFEKD